MPLVLIACFVAGLVATSGGSFLIAAVPAAAYLGAPMSSPAAATAVTCAWGGAVPGDVARLVTVVAVAERAISLALRLAPLPGLYDALKGPAIPFYISGAPTGRYATNMCSTYTLDLKNFRPFVVSIFYLYLFQISN